MREWLRFDLYNTDLFVNQLITYSDCWEHFLLLNSNSGKTNSHLYPSFEIIAACDAIHRIKTVNKNGFENLKQFSRQHDDWIFGHLNYDLKNEVEDLASNNPDKIQFPDLFFFVPKYLFKFRKDVLHIGYLPGISTQTDILTLYKEITHIDVNNCNTDIYTASLQHNFTQQEYINEVEKIRRHIFKGDIYELNFCTEFSSNGARIEPFAAYQSLNKISPAPFSGYYKLVDKYLLSSSPERFLAKRGNKIISQPIKGTIKRGRTKEEDEQLRSTLESDEKERAENIMIVDLVRNDLSRTAKKGSVIVEELCKIYSFKYVHQMISTIVSEIDDEKYHPVDVIKHAFPMGSMTGAPKVRAMELIERFEKNKRGLYSGCIGYIDPDKNFDFNVVIRSILYNKTKEYLSFSVGSAITYKSIPEKEYQECLLKAEAMITVFSGELTNKKS